jgi:hypothetical protein
MGYGINGGVGMINEDSLIYDVILEHPETKKVFRKYGIKCFG